MNRKSNNGGGDGDDSHHSKRRRWNGDAGGGKNNDDSYSSRAKDLAEKTRGRDDGYGYPSSDSDDESTIINRINRSSSGNKASKSKPRRARTEQRLGMRSFRTTAANDTGKDDDDSENGGAKEAAAALPTPRGWAQLSKKDCSARLKTPRPPTDVSKSSGFTLSSAPRAAMAKKNNPYLANNNNNKTASTNKTPATKSTNSSSSAPSTMKTSRTTTTKPRTTHHVVCAVSENLARETCVASIDAGRPTYLHITKQGNGQTYAETMSLLRMLNPDEVLLNEGRRNSQLATKIMALFGQQELDGMDTMVAGGGKNLFGNKKNASNNANARGRKSRFPNRGGGKGGDAEDDLASANMSSSACETTTVVKFVPRSYFDQTKGAEILRKLAREDTYDASLVEEYILLSSSYAVLQYAQLCLGAGLTRGSLALDINVGGNHRMNIDRSTMVNLELLVNAKTGRTANSLVGTIDCTKTSVGGRLLRTNFMAPPTRLDTINARLDLVDSLLEDEEFFYVIMEHLEDLPDVDKMLSYVALAPRKRFDNGNGALFGNTERQAVTARIASKGISALVCIKSTLLVIPSFAHVLEVQLKELDERENQSSGAAAAAGTAAYGRNRERSDSGQEDDESTTVVESETSRNEDDSSTVDLTHDTAMGDAGRTTMTPNSTLNVGLGTNSSNKNNAASMHSHSNKQTRHQLLRAILIAMKQPALSRVLNAVTDIFTESTAFSKNSHAMRHQECFALKPNTDGMMDVLRKAFLANVDDIYRLADEYAETYDITVQVRETTSRGYYLSVSADLGLDLPSIFIQPVKNGRFIHCTSEEVYSLNNRAQENVQDLLLMTHGRIQEVLQVARDNYDCIASLSDAIALLDMCHCFADNVASSRSAWCRPVLSDRGRNPSQEDGSVEGGGAIAIRNGRYAIDVSSTGVNSSISGEDFVPNDTYSSALQNFTVITGINGSGKSTYLKQIALIVILAHCGCYVPADEALLPIRDQICTRIGTADDQEHNISTFLLEMKETAFICNSTTYKSLFLLDELGRATSNEDGIAIAWSVSEYLLTKRAMTFFVTHYPQLSKLAEVYPNVQNQHLGSQISSSSNGDTNGISYTHKIMPGPCTAAGDYGVEMAATCGWPDDAIRNARRIRQEVKRKMPGEDLCYNENSKHNENFAENRRNAHNVLCDIAKHLAAVKEGEGRLSNEAKKNFLEELRDRLVPTNDESLVRMIRNLLLNVDGAIPMIPLARSTPAVALNNAVAKAAKDNAVVKEGAVSTGQTAEIVRGMQHVNDSTKQPPEKTGICDANKQWSCEFGSSSSSSSDDDSDGPSMEEERSVKSQNNKKHVSLEASQKQQLLQPELPIGKPVEAVQSKSSRSKSNHAVGTLGTEAVENESSPSESKSMTQMEGCPLESNHTAGSLGTEAVQKKSSPSESKAMTQVEGRSLKSNHAIGTLGSDADARSSVRRRSTTEASSTTSSCSSSDDDSMSSSSSGSSSSSDTTSSSSSGSSSSSSDEE